MSVESSVLEKGALEAMFWSRGGECWHVGLGLSVLEMRTAVGKGLLTHHYRAHALTCF